MEAERSNQREEVKRMDALYKSKIADLKLCKESTRVTIVMLWNRQIKKTYNINNRESTHTDLRSSLAV